MIIVETSTGKTRFFRDIIEYLDYTENGFQDMIADDIGSHLDPINSNISIYQDSYTTLDEIPELPEVPPMEDWTED